MKELLIFSFLIIYTFANDVVMTITPTSSSVQTNNDYDIFINRTKSVTGATITPSAIGNPILVKLVFEESYDISAATVNTYPFTKQTNDNSITITVNTSLYDGQKISIYLNDVVNPLPSDVQLLVYASIMNDAEVQFDYAQTNLQFDRVNFVGTTYQFSPSTVSTLSNLSITLSPSVWEAGMGIKVAFQKYWTYSMLNISSTTIFSSTSSCTPQCTIIRQSTFTEVTFSTLPDQSSSITLLFQDIISPPTLEEADSVSISSIQSTYNSVPEDASLLVGASQVNGMEQIATSTDNLIQETINIQIQVISTNIFGPDDTITIQLTSPLTSSRTITITSVFINSYVTQVQSSTTIKISSFTFVTSNYNKLNAVLSITGITPSSSTKPITSNTITLSRNGYSYNSDTFQFSVGIQALTASASLSNNDANSNTTCQWTIYFNTSVGVDDLVYMKIPSTITINECSTLCVNCGCEINPPNATNPYTQLKLLGFQSDLSQITVSTALKNPISSGEVIDICSTDSENYTKECGSVSYPDIEEASLNTSVITLQMSNFQVYAISNYTIHYDLTSYNLQNGFLITNLPEVLTLINPSSPVCTINGQTTCIVTISNSSNIVINTTVTSDVKEYTLVINNIRNPQSTEPFTIFSQIAYTSGQYYYNINSQYYSATTPYPLKNSHYTLAEISCQNYVLNKMTITFQGLPFQPDVAIVQVTNVDQGTVKQLEWGNTIEYEFRNPSSLAPSEHTFRVITSNELYQIYQFSITRENCEGSYLSINSFQVAGLPEDPGTLSFSFNLIHDATHIRILFPEEYPQSITISSDITVTKLSPRLFSLSLPTTQPIMITVWDYTNILASSYFELSLYDENYLVSYNNDTILYELTAVTTCVFPCKICVSASCRECFSPALTSSYLLHDEQCKSVCPSGTYPGDSSCIDCPLQCSICSSNTSCSKCTSFYYLLSDTCLTDCPAEYYPSDINQTCEACVHPCVECVDETICETCASTFIFLAGECLTSCPTNFININEICEECQLPCSTCSGDITNCTSCANGFYLYEFNCVSICPGDLIGFQGICQQCDGTCETCWNNPQTCSSCPSPFKLYNSTCHSSCFSGFYEDSSVCLQCNVGCSTCTSLTQCQTCSTGYILLNTSCVTSCPFTTFTYNDTALNTLSCRDCQTGCLQCTSSSICISCATSMYLVSDVCLSSCPAATYPDGSSCLSCESGCVQCSSDTICLACEIAYSLYNGNCVWDCPDNTTSQNGTCTQCWDILSNCQICSSQGCSVCLSNYYLHESSCISDCPIGYIADGQKCSKCEIGCSSCSNSIDNCTSCESGYFFYANTCVSNCPAPLIVINDECIACSSPCVTCQTTSTNCISCESSYYLHNNNCYTSCPSQYYAESSIRQCVACESGCLSCSVSGCSQCLSGYFHNEISSGRYECYQSCPSHLPYIINSYTCSQCAENCQQCSETQCLVCSSGYRYGQYCVEECPPPLSASSGSCVEEVQPPEPPQPPVQPPVEPELVDVPMPFTIVLGVLLICCIGSRLQHPSSSFTMCLLASASLLTPICNIVYLIILFSTLDEQYVMIILVAGIGLNYVSNILHSIFSFATYRKDDSFREWAGKHKCANWLIFIISLLTEHLFFVIYFSRMFNLPFFKATVLQIQALSCQNYFWAIALVSNMIGIASGFLLISITQSTATSVLLDASDIIVLNGVVLIFGLILFKKNRELWETPDNYSLSSGLSAKKVIFDDDSNQNLAQMEVESMEEVNGKIVGRGNKVSNQYEVKGKQNLEGEDLYFMNENDEGGSQSTDPMKIQASLNMKILAEQMQPHSFIKEVSESALLSEGKLDENGQRVLKNQSPIKKDFSNIFSPTKTLEEKMKSRKSLKSELPDSPHLHYHRTKSVSELRKDSPPKSKEKSSSKRQSSQKTLKSNLNFDEESMKNPSKVEEERYNASAVIKQEEKQEDREEREEKQERNVKSNRSKSINSSVQKGRKSLSKDKKSARSQSRSDRKSRGGSKSKEKAKEVETEERYLSRILQEEKSLSPSIIRQRQIRHVDKEMSKSVPKVDFIKEAPRIAPYVFNSKNSKVIPTKDVHDESEKKIKNIKPFNTIKLDKFGRNRNEHRSIDKKEVKSFASRNLSMERKPVNTTISYIEDESSGKRMNMKSLMSEIERKERIRNHKQSLKQIYLHK